MIEAKASLTKEERDGLRTTLIQFVGSGDFETISQLFNDLDAKDAEIAGLKVINGANQGRLVELDAEVKSADDTIASLEDKLARANERIGELDHALDDAVKLYQHFQDQLTKAEDVLMEVQDWANGTGNDAAEIRAILRRIIGAYFDAKNGEKADVVE